MKTVRALLLVITLITMNTTSCQGEEVREAAYSPSKSYADSVAQPVEKRFRASSFEAPKGAKLRARTLSMNAADLQPSPRMDSKTKVEKRFRASSVEAPKGAELRVRAPSITRVAQVADAKQGKGERTRTSEKDEADASLSRENNKGAKAQDAKSEAQEIRATEKRETEAPATKEDVKRETSDNTAPPAAVAFNESMPTQFKKITTKGLDIKLGKSCVTTECHSDMSKAKYIHGPVAISACTACHKTVGEPADDGKPTPKHQFTFEKLGNDLCYSCHNRQDTGEVVHEPVMKELCTACHDSHTSENKFLLVRSTIGEMCYTCHQDDINKEDKYAHGPVAVGACITCHSSHSSANKKLLVASGNDLCFLCHDKIKTELATLKYQHKAAVEDCSQCHTHHTSPNKFQLKKTIPELCADCHAEQVMYTEVAVTKHGAITSGDKCLNCHGPHATNYPHELREPPIDLCLKCHDKEIETPTGTIINMKAELANHSNHHGPIRQGNCVPCHNVHGSEFFRLLDKYFPPEFYAPFKVEKYSLCFKCHEETLVLDERTTTLTDFRNGDQNLHYLHINKETKGRTCRACHEVHASDNPKHIREWTFFGPMKWKLPIGFKKTNTGGSCAPGCHKPKAYDRLKPADYAR